MPLTIPWATTLRPDAGSMTVSRTLRTACSVISAMSLARRLIEGMAAVTYMQPGMKAKVPAGRLEVRMAWNNNGGGPWAAAAVAVAAATAVGRGGAAAAEIAAVAAARSVTAGLPTWKT